MTTRGPRGRAAASAIYVTVNYYGKTQVAERPPCAGCTPPPVDGVPGLIVPPERAEYQVVGASGAIALCRDCAIHSIKALAARFVLFDRSATRDLMDFFAAEAVKKQRAPRRRRRPAKFIDVVAPRLLEERKRSP